MPKEHIEVAIEAEYSPEQFSKIALGYVPEAMEEKWFFFLENMTLYIHRSWTGYCMFEVDFVEREGNYHTVRARINRNKKQYTDDNNSIDCEISFLRNLIDNWLVNREMN